ncbi:MAG: baseplate J/gp47 family protein [Bacteroidales bacterium]|nr:baseplate J/gp47 family protein [Bacteroidales bacterium]
MNLMVQAEDFQAAVIKDIKENDKLKKLTNMNEHSRWFMIVCAVSRVAVYYINALVILVYDSIFAHSSDRYHLSRHLKEEGLEYKEAQKAIVNVRVGSSELPAEMFPIEQGYIVKTKSGRSFELIESGSISPETIIDDKGYYTVLLQARAVETGEEYNVPADTIVEWETSPEGIDIVYNPEEAENGSNDESEESALERLSVAKQVIKRGSLDWFKSETETFDSIRKAIPIPRYAGLGTVGIICCGYSGQVSDEVLTAVEDKFNLTDEDPAEAYRVVALRPEEFIQDFEVTVWYDSEGDEPTDEILAEICDAFVDDLDIGEKIIPRSLESRYINAGMKDCAVTLPSSIIDPAINDIIVRGTVTFTKVAFDA